MPGHVKKGGKHEQDPGLISVLWKFQPNPFRPKPVAHPHWWAEEGGLAEALWWVFISLSNHSPFLSLSVFPTTHLFSRCKEECVGSWRRGRLRRGHDRQHWRRKSKTEIFVKSTLTSPPIGQCQSRLGGKDLQGEPADASEPPEDGEVWGRFQHDLPQRGFCALESQVEIRLQVDLCKFVIWNCKTK